MITHHSMIKHDPPNSYGDCLRATVASILEIDHVEDVPHFADAGADGEEMQRRLRRYLATKGFGVASFMLDGSASLSEVLEFMARVNPGIYYMIYGNNGYGDHVAVGLNDKIVHDVSWYPMTLKTAPSSGTWQISLIIAGQTLCR